MTLHADILTARQKKVLSTLGPVATERGFYLAGGTAVALHLGHRRSVDFDWFLQGRLTEPLQLAAELQDEGVPLVTERVERGTLYGVVRQVRVSFLEFRYRLLAPPVPWPEFHCRLASLEDLACMKLSAIAQRGAKKDFIDLYALGREGLPLSRALRLYREKFEVDDLSHLLYALVYFDDADAERMPRMLWRTDWRTVKATIREWVRDLQDPLRREQMLP